MDSKRCARCGETKPLDAFNPIARGGTKLRPRCKQCTKLDRRERYLTQNGADQSYEQVLKREYGITLAEYNEMLRKQAHRCAICRRGETAKVGGRPKRLAVDHDHITGAVRGLLCQRCNLLVWALEDNHTTLAAIGAYIEEFRATFANGAPI